MSITVTPQHTCKCGKKMDRASGITGDRGPKSGDISVCLRCGNINIFNEDLTLRDLTMDELLELKSQPENWDTVQAARTYIFIHNGKGAK